MESNQSKALPIVFCADKNVQNSLLIAIHSLCSNTYSPLDIIVFTPATSRVDERLLYSFISELFNDRLVTIRAITMAVDVFREFPALHGNYMPYARLMIAEFLQEYDKVVYLDCDLIVGSDIQGLFRLQLGDAAVAAVSWHKKDICIEREVFKKYSQSLTAPYFNSGVLVINTEFWRRGAVMSQFLTILEEIKGMETVVDQTVLNVAFNERWLKLEQAWNWIPQWRAFKRSADFKIIHYVGNPKPWDPLGVLVANESCHYQFFIKNNPKLKKFLVKKTFREKFNRLWKNKRSYASFALRNIEMLLKSELPRNKVRC